jgi:hypothetical protein
MDRRGGGRERVSVAPQTAAARLLELAHTVADLAAEIAAVRAQVRTILLRPAALSGIDRRFADLLRRQLELLERARALAQAQLTHLGTDATGQPPGPAQDEPADP